MITRYNYRIGECLTLNSFVKFLILFDRQDEVISTDIISNYSYENFDENIGMFNGHFNSNAIQITNLIRFENYEFIYYYFRFN